MKPIISIIIPVYNVEEYLRKCLDSCINQTFKDIEIIVVNDCSPDNSDKIMREYEKNYPDIIKCLYLTKNLRQGGARNKGLEIAKGEYVLFVDSDDYIANNMCEKLYESVFSNDADVVICDYFRVVNDLMTHKSQFDKKMSNKNNISKELLLKERVKPGPCCKLYKRALISDIFFPENVYYEDFAITVVWLLSARKINYINLPLYYYVTRKNSVICIREHSIMLQYAKATITLLENLKRTGLYEKYSESVSIYILKKICDFLYKYIFYYLEYGQVQISFLSQYINENIYNWKDILNRKCNFKQYEKNIIYNFLQDNTYLTRLYEKSKVFLPQLFENNIVAIWGLGLFGKNMLNYFNKFNIKPNYIIDNNIELHGLYSENILITSFENIKEKCSIIIVTINEPLIFNEVKEKINKENKNIRVMYFAELFEV